MRNAHGGCRPTVCPPKKIYTHTSGYLKLCFWPLLDKAGGQATRKESDKCEKHVRTTLLVKSSGALSYGLGRHEDLNL